MPWGPRSAKRRSSCSAPPGKRRKAASYQPAAVAGAACYLLGCRCQQLHGGQIPWACGALDVVRTLRRRCAARRQGSRHPVVCAELPAAPCLLVHSCTNKRVAETKPPGLARQPHQLARKQRVQRRQDGAHLHVGGRRGKLGLERVPGHRRAFQHEPHVGRQRGQLCDEHREHGTRNSCRPRLAAAHPRATRAGKLLEVERVAAALLIEALARRPAGLR